MSQNKHIYETTFIVNASLEDPQIETTINHITETITRNGGEINSVNKWGRKRLAYTIKKKNNGFYVNIEFTSAGSTVTQLDRIYLLDENILRYLTIHLDKKALEAKLQAPTKPSVEEPSTPEGIEREPLFEDEETPPEPAPK